MICCADKFFNVFDAEKNTAIFNVVKLLRYARMASIEKTSVASKGAKTKPSDQKRSILELIPVVTYH